MTDEIDYCLLCAQEVERDKWRDHMIYHKHVLVHSPFVDGKWVRLDDCILAKPEETEE